ncbi:multiheme c-type cytochrome [Nannocystis punicea]|uniref:Multiheme c-type cytochrome n=1 Tax=Nannocystis punicea TaxID=2995304 RepID=A0ABY7H5L9_9BACT|nr:multiheme c-type cytochrome [Nannocystis poenicansa]WAS94583.1 multiheme c-type cytochrome [Nannocystis poenicansa]
MKTLRTILTLIPLACGGGGSPSGPDELLSDELSMPREPTVALDGFASAEQCGLCHEAHYLEWSTSGHAYAMIDPVFRAFVAVRQEHYGGKQDMFCLQCHSPIGTRGGDIVPGFDFADLQPITLEGVTCESCHKVASLARPYNSGHVLDPDGPMRGTIAEPIISAAHESQFSPLHGAASFCAGCHDLREVSGLVLERPYGEWQGSPAAAAGVQCQGCHMPSYEGPAVVGGPTRRLHRHTWIGAGIPLLEGFLTAEEKASLRAEVKRLLASAARVDITADTSVRAGDVVDLFVAVTNNIAAHNFPTGSTFNRQAWVEVVVRDSDGRIVFATGTLDAGGEPSGSSLAAPGAPELLRLGSILVDERGEPVLFPWRAAEHVSNALGPLRERVFRLRVPTGRAARGPLSAEARILFRAFSPTALRALGLDEYAAGLEIHEVSRDRIRVELRPP